MKHKLSSRPRGANEATAAIDRLTSRRRDLESRFVELRGALRREIGWAPSGKTWALPFAAFASGLALAAWLVTRRRES